MTEYWKSNPRYCCPVCNVWMADNIASRRKHEQGNKHIFAVQDMMRKKREQKFQSAREDLELKRELKSIEMAAAASHASDAKHFPGATIKASAAVEKSGVHYFPQFFSHKVDGGKSTVSAGVKSISSKSNGDEVEDGEGEEEGGSSGRYEIDGCWYLDGKTCEDRLEDGVVCELFCERAEGEEDESDEWFPAKIISSRVIIVPHADTSFRRFTVQYGNDFSKEEKDVGSDRLRLVIDENEVKKQEEKEAATVKSAMTPLPTDENTGIGGWQTISVREVDLQAEERERSEKERGKAARATQKAAKADREERIVAAMDADDAMGSYDPYGTGTYRGVKIESGDGGQQQTSTVYDADQHLHRQTSQPVAFKKRKKMGMKKRRDDCEE